MVGIERSRKIRDQCQFEIGESQGKHGDGFSARRGKPRLTSKSNHHGKVKAGTYLAFSSVEGSTRLMTSLNTNLTQERPVVVKNASIR